MTIPTPSHNPTDTARFCNTYSNFSYYLPFISSIFKNFSGFSFLIFLVSLPLFSLPTPPRLEELVKDSDYIAKVKLTKCIQKKLTEKEISVTCKGDVQEAYKTKAPLPGKMDIAFLIFPEKFGKWLRVAPKEGDYILHFIDREATDSKGTPRNLIVLYEPHPFAIHEYSLEYETKIRNALK